MASPFPPGVNPATVPAAPPPPGIVPNLVDPEDLEAVTIAISVLMIVLTLTAVALRFYSTALVTRSTGLEDCEYTTHSLRINTNGAKTFV